MSDVVFGAEPRVNLLPPEVAQRTRARAIRRVLGFLVILTLLVAAGGFGAAFLYAADAQAGLASAQARTQELLTEQLEYADASAVSTLVDATTKARLDATATEIVWADVLVAIAGYLPEGARVDSFTALVQAPWEEEMIPTGPLRETRIATMTLVVMSTTALDGTNFYRALTRLTGYADATPDSVELAGSEFRTTVSLNLDTEALTGRFPIDGAEVTK